MNKMMEEILKGHTYIWHLKDVTLNKPVVEALTLAHAEGKREGIEEARLICHKVVNERIGLHDQVYAFKLGHSLGAFICAEEILKLLPSPTGQRVDKSKEPL